MIPTSVPGVTQPASLSSYVDGHLRIYMRCRFFSLCRGVHLVALYAARNFGDAGGMDKK